MFLRMMPAKHNTFWKGALTTAAFAAAAHLVNDNFISHVDPCPASVQADYFKSLMNAAVKADSISDVRIVLSLPKTGKCAVQMRVPGDISAAATKDRPANPQP